MASQTDFQEYFEWVKSESKKHHGTRFGKGGLETCDYIPLDVLKDYWQPDRVQHFLTPTSSNQLTSALPCNTVIQSFLRIFATLVYISGPGRSRIRYLDAFSTKSRDDNQLPFREKEDLASIFADPWDRDATQNAFYRCQFLFSPRQIATRSWSSLNNTLLADEDVLPIVFIRDLNPGLDNKSVAELKLFELAPSSGLQTKNNLLVAKIFPEDESEFTFRNEIVAYTALNRASYSTQESSQYFLSYYGSFVQQGRGVILLEYADRGSLLEFFKRGDVPYTREEMFDLWTGLVDLFRGLAELHNTNSRHTNTTRGVHQDLQPSNIFVFSDGSDSQYKFRFKLGDFGLSSFQLYNTAKDSFMPDNKSAKVYAAPELMTWDPNLDHLDNGVTPSVDMWSMGCVLFEVGVWSVCGPRGRAEFLEDRQAETQDEAPGCHSAFHNGKLRLRAVQNMADKLLPRLRGYDTLTGQLCQWICDHLLVETRHRLNAEQAAYNMGRIIDNAHTTPHHVHPPESVYSSPDQTSPGRMQSVLQGGVPTTPFRASVSSIESYSPHLPPVTSRNLVSPPLNSSTQPTYKHDHSYQDFEDPTQPPGRAKPLSLGYNTLEHRPNSSGLYYTRDSRHLSSSGLYGSPPTLGHAGHVGSSVPFLVEEPEVMSTTGRIPSTTPNADRQPPPRQMSDAPTIKAPSTIDEKRVSRSYSIASRAAPTQTRPTNDVTITQLIDRRRKVERALPKGLEDIPGILQGRDQVFLVDNSSSMIPYWAHVKDTVEGLVSILKTIDPDGVELRFTSRPAVSYQSRNTSDLLNKVSANNPSASSECMMEQALSVLIDSLIPTTPSSGKNTSALKGIGRNLFGKSASSKKTGISVYILTNGIWGRPGVVKAGDSERPDMRSVDETVRTLVERLKSRQMSRSYITLQFIRFGHDRLGKRRLRYLDNEMKAVTGWDIVDRRYFRRNVRPMLLGALSEAEDLESDDSEDDDPVSAGAG